MMHVHRLASSLLCVFTGASFLLTSVLILTTSRPCGDTRPRPDVQYFREIVTELKSEVVRLKDALDERHLAPPIVAAPDVRKRRTLSQAGKQSQIPPANQKPAPRVIVQQLAESAANRRAAKSNSPIKRNLPANKNPPQQKQPINPKQQGQLRRNTANIPGQGKPISRKPNTNLRGPNNVEANRKPPNNVQQQNGRKQQINRKTVLPGSANGRTRTAVKNQSQRRTQVKNQSSSRKQVTNGKPAGLNQSDASSQRTNEKPSAPVHVIIFTNRRSGSSFLGELFNQNPDVFYLFEPLKALEQRVSYQNLQVQAAPTLGDMMTCNFTGLRYFLNFTSKERLHRTSSRALSSPPLCPTSIRWSPSAKLQGCRELSPDMVSDVCRSKQHVAVKTIRLVDIKSLASLVRNPKLNVKVVHLIRDPRGIYNSRVNEKRGEKGAPDTVAEQMNFLCKREAYNLQVGRSPLPWLAGRYKLFRYEDIAQRPLQQVQLLYDFVGLPLPSHVTQWIMDNTQADGDSSLYTTSRNSSATAHAWRHAVPWQYAQKVEGTCAKMLDLAGYKRAPSEAHLYDMSYSLMGPIPTPNVQPKGQGSKQASSLNFPTKVQLFDESVDSLALN
ncbi:carbohydrate sulfotransferase 1-like [Branchiostoma floridae]|uniref:Carbohydrate sulfotransferase 1-like n=1 Tax=Branchiostoma floridae TaxID=7739 RepID=A0A9J7M0D7_BRAFL|nr:carbohydrate sulfotransferase 1-like [Branchiostoma floridae]XP_035691004.1 carbohydrate sulfotransferase 1-like [Branchiostoma floridae]XP_035691005.1 carbohydrate sulfotransferase 1-like [Branchiostoma floridae]